jgi:putative flippase GtrA
LTRSFPYGFRITVADNASTDGTWAAVRDLTLELPGVRAVRIAEKGRGRALRHVWAASDADVVAYMDVDLSTGLAAFLPLVAPLLSGHSDLAIGTRLSRGSNVVRGPKREVISRAYNLLLRSVLGARFTDAQCGFKAGRTEVVQALLPTVQDQEWFFDTEILLAAERQGLRIPDSRVDIVKTAADDLKGIWRVIRARSFPRFAAVGVVSTLAYLALFWLLRSFSPPVVANAVALFATAVANTVANRRFTFGVTGRAGVLRHHAGGLVAFGAGLALTTAGLALLPDSASRTAELVAVVLANGLATAVRFLLLRAWIFAPNQLPGRAG